MSRLATLLRRTHDVLHAQIIVCLLLTNAAGGLWPQWGRLLRGLSLGQITLGSATLQVTVPTLLLSVLLLNAGLGVQWRSLQALRHQPQLLVWGLLVRPLFPLLVALPLAVAHRAGYTVAGGAGLVVGLTFIAALPIAGAAPAWAQNVNGNVALALGLTVLSTLLSPFTIPIGIDLAAHLTTGSFASDLQHLLNRGTELFLVLAVALPCAAAVVARGMLGEARIKTALPSIKIINLAALLLLNYINASAALPQALSHPDWAFMGLTLAVITLVCAASFAAGPLLAHLCKASQADSIALLFCMGMCNNGSGLVLVASAFQEHPHALLTLVVYGVVQQLMAGLATRWCELREAVPQRGRRGVLSGQRRTAA